VILLLIVGLIKGERGEGVFPLLILPVVVSIAFFLIADMDAVLSACFRRT
jgi:hypothetical protein